MSRFRMRHGGTAAAEPDRGRRAYLWPTGRIRSGAREGASPGLRTPPQRPGSRRARTGRSGLAGPGLHQRSRPMYKPSKRVIAAAAAVAITAAAAGAAVTFTGAAADASVTRTSFQMVVSKGAAACIPGALAKVTIESQGPVE